MVRAKVLALFVLVLLVLFSSIVFATSIILGDQGTNVIVSATGAKLTSGDLTVSIYDAATGGNLIYQNTFTGGIVNGTWDVDLNFTAEYGKLYYKDYAINGDDLDFSGQERKAFMSPLGDISVATNISAAYFHGSGANLTGLPTGSGWTNTSTETNSSLLVNVLNNILSTKNVTAANFHGVGTNLTGLPIQSGGWTNTSTQVNNSLLVNVLNNIFSTNNVSAAFFHGNGGNLTGVPIQSGGWTNTTTESNNSLLVNVQNNFLSTKNVSAANFHGVGTNLTGLPIQSGGWSNTSTQTNTSLLVNVLNNIFTTNNVTASFFHGGNVNISGNVSTVNLHTVSINVSGNVSATNFHGGDANLTYLLMNQSVKSPLIFGGLTTTSNLALRPTTGNGGVGSDIIFQAGNNGSAEVMRLSTIQPSSATSYTNSGGSGNRAGIVNVTQSASLMFSTASPPTLIDGITTNQGWFNAVSVAGRFLLFDFGTGISKLIVEAKWYQSYGQGQGVWQWQGSNDNSSFTDIGATFTLGSDATQTITTLSANTNGYRYYRLLGVSGTASDGPYTNEIEFKIGAAGYYYYAGINNPSPNATLDLRSWTTSTDIAFRLQDSGSSTIFSVLDNGVTTINNNVSATNFHGNNINISGNVSALNLHAGSINVSSNVSATNFHGGNINISGNVTAANFHGSGANLTGLPIQSGGWVNSSTESNNSLILTANANSTFMNRTGFGRQPITTSTVIINATPGDTYGLYVDRYNVDTVNVTTGVTKYAFRADIGTKSVSQAKTNNIYAFTGTADQRNIFSNGGSTTLNQATVGGLMSVVDVGGLAGTSWSDGQHSSPSSIGMQGAVTDYYSDTSNISDTRYWAYGGSFTAATNSYTVNKPSGFIQKNYVGTYGAADSRGATETNAGTLYTNAYGGYYIAQGDTVGTSVCTSLYAVATGCDTNNAAIFDGQVFVRTYGSNNGKISIADAAIINEDSNAEGNMRVEGDTETTLLFTNASADRVGIGKDDPKTKLQVSGNLSSSKIFVYNLTGGTDACTVKWNANTSELYCQT
ncbi:hypothetical protein HZA97_05240 [Candidatus Woesearchaeota archaeon]|nr:hypothetical protein [Candidatus Woesearchaeota archaeon]